MVHLSETTIVFLVFTLAIGEITDRRSILLHEHGFLLREHGMLYLDTNNVYLSVFLNLAIPKFELHDSTEPCRNELTTQVKRANTEALSVAQVLVNRHGQLLDVDNGIGKPKRSIAAALGIGIGVFNLIFTGVAEFRVSKHIREVQNEFYNFKTQQSYINKKFINVLEKTVSVVDHDLKRLAVEMNSMECVQALILQQADINVRIQKWVKKLEQIFYYINKGSLSGSLNSFILEPSDLIKILNDHKELHNTIYSENLMLFYQSTKVAYLESEVSSDSNFLSLHLILEIPLLQKSKAYLLFKVDKIPLVINGTCLTVQSTKYMFSKTAEYEFMDLNEESCDIRDLISICNEIVPQNLNRSTCIDGNNCELKQTSCEPTRFIYHYTGILVSGQGS